MSRIVALIGLSAYMCTGLVLIGWSAAFGIALFLAVPLACILWPEIMAEAKGIRTVPLPPEMVVTLGWVLFLLPAILAAAVWLVVN